MFTQVKQWCHWCHISAPLATLQQYNIYIYIYGYRSISWIRRPTTVDKKQEISFHTTTTSCCFHFYFSQVTITIHTATKGRFKCLNKEPALLLLRTISKIWLIITTWYWSLAEKKQGRPRRAKPWKMSRLIKKREKQNQLDNECNREKQRKETASRKREQQNGTS